MQLLKNSVKVPEKHYYFRSGSSSYEKRNTMCSNELNSTMAIRHPYPQLSDDCDKLDPNERRTILMTIKFQ